MKRPISLVLVACATACTTPQSNSLSSITVKQRATYVVCAGYCPNLDATVRPNGQVTLLKHTVGGQRHTRFKVTIAQASQFIDILRPYDSSLRDDGFAACDFWTTTDPAILNVYPEEIVWTHADGTTSRLRSCGGGRLFEAISRASHSIGLHPGGEPRI